MNAPTMPGGAGGCKRTGAWLLLFAAILVAIPAPPTVAADDPLSMWYRLDQDDRDLIRSQLKQHLPAMMPAGVEQEYTEYFVNHVEAWARFAGHLEAGDYTEASGILANEAAPIVFGHFEGQLPPGSTTARVYAIVKGHPDTVREVGIALLDPNAEWSGVAMIVWDKAKEELDTVGRAQARAMVVNTINWVTTERAIVGYTPGDLYMVAVENWIELIGKAKQRWIVRTENALYGVYRDHRREGLRPQVARERTREVLIAGKLPGSVATYHSGLLAAGVDADELLNLFERFYTADAARTDFAAWFQAKATEVLRQRANAERARIAREADQAREVVQREAKRAQAAAARRLRILIEQRMTGPQGKERDEAVKRARKILDSMIAQTKQRIRETAAAYRTRREALAAALEEYHAKRVETIHLFADRIEQLTADIELYRESLKPIFDAHEELTTAAGDVAGVLDTLEARADAICKLVEKVSAAESKSAAREIVDEAIGLGREAHRAVARMRQIDATVKVVGRRLQNQANQVLNSRHHRTVNTMQNDLKGLQAKLELPREAEALRRRYREDLQALKELAERARVLRQSVETRRQSIDGILTPHNPNEEILEIQRDAAEVEGVVSEFHIIAEDWGADFVGPWRGPRPPMTLTFNEEERAAFDKALKAGEALAKLPRLQQMPDYVEQLMGVFRAAVEVEMPYAKLRADGCLAEILKRYSARWSGEPADRLAADLADLQRRVSQLEGHNAAVRASLAKAGELAELAVTHAEAAETFLAQLQAAAARTRQLRQTCARAREVRQELNKLVSQTQSGEQLLRQALDGADSLALRLQTAEDRQKALAAYSAADRLLRDINATKVVAERSGEQLRQLLAQMADPPAEVRKEAVADAATKASEALGGVRGQIEQVRSLSASIQSERPAIEQAIADRRRTYADLPDVVRQLDGLSARVAAITLSAAARTDPPLATADAAAARAAAAEQAAAGLDASFGPCDVAGPEPAVNRADTALVLATLRVTQSAPLRALVEAWRPSEPPVGIAESDPDAGPADDSETSPDIDQLTRGVRKVPPADMSPDVDQLARGVRKVPPADMSPDVDQLTRGVRKVPPGTSSPGVDGGSGMGRARTVPPPDTPPAGTERTRQVKPARDAAEDDKPVYAVYAVHPYPSPPRDPQQFRPWMQRALDSRTFQPQARPMGHIAFHVTGQVLDEYRQHQRRRQAGETTEPFELFRPNARYHQMMDTAGGGGQRMRAPLLLSFVRLEREEPVWVRQTRIGIQATTAIAGDIHPLGDSRTRGSWSAQLQGNRLAFGPLRYDGDDNWTLATRGHAVGFMKNLIRAIEGMFR